MLSNLIHNGSDIQKESMSVRSQGTKEKELKILRISVAI